MGHKIAAIAFALFGFAWSPLGYPVIVDIDRFTVTRDSTVKFSDDFDDGTPPPSAPNFIAGAPASYDLLGSFPPGSEAAGLLRLDTANGGLTGNATGDPRLTVAATLLTHAAPGAAAGLRIGNTLQAEALFELVQPIGPRFNGYSLMFTDADAGAQHQAAELQVRFNAVLGVADIHYQLQDFDARSITSLGRRDLAPPAGADQVLLQIARPDATSNEFFASFRFLQDGNEFDGGGFATPAVLFQGEDFVRARFLAFTAVPEPTSLGLLGAGLLALAAAGKGAARRRRPAVEGLARRP